MLLYEVLMDFSIGGVPYHARNSGNWIPAGVNCKFDKGLTYELEHWNTSTTEVIKAHSNIPVEALDFYGEHNTSLYYYYVTKSMIIPISEPYINKLTYDAKWVDANASAHSKAVAASVLATNLVAKAAAAGTPVQPSGGLIGSSSIKAALNNTHASRRVQAGKASIGGDYGCKVPKGDHCYTSPPEEEEGSRYSKIRKCLLCGSPAYMGLNTFECSKGCK